MLKSVVTDGGGTDKAARVLSDNELLVGAASCPPLLPQKNRVFGQNFTVDGLSSGSDDLGVDGSATAVPYWIPADEDDDRYITKVSFIMGYGTSAQMWEFADANTALTNGVKLAYDGGDNVEHEILNFKANYHFFSASDAGVTADWEDRGFAATGDYGYYVNINLAAIMPIYGIKLDRGSTQRVTITIRDDCTDADLFICKALGFDRFE